MLISFTLENFKSFRGRASLNLLARKADKTLQSALIVPPSKKKINDRLLAATAIYGPNASGKTNLLIGLWYVRRAVLHSQSTWKANTGTRFDANLGNKDVDGFFEIEMIIQSIRYRYGFSVSRFKFSEEWLFCYPLGRERLLFHRTSTEKDDEIDYELETGATLSGDKREHESSFRRTRENSLFISAAAQDNQTECLLIQEWFKTNVVSEIRLNVNALDQGLTSILAFDYPNFKSLLIPLMKAADPCIKDIVVRRESVGESRRDANDSEDHRFSKENVDRHKVNFIVCSNGTDIEIPFEKQSRGIKRLYSLSAGLITALKFGRVCIIDELETSMHSHVASQLLALFQNRSSNPRGAQLIFTTHETRLLNLQHLRRDQVWFCERDSNGHSSLYSLIEFSPRKDENFEIGYIRGRYGAVPAAGIDPSWLKAINDDKVSLPSEVTDA